MIWRMARGMMLHRGTKRETFRAWFPADADTDGPRLSLRGVR